MTISNQTNEAYVWIWLPNATEPVVAAKLQLNGSDYQFVYGRSYIENSAAIAFNSTDLPLERHNIFRSHDEVPGVIRDAMPDAWGQRVLLHRYQKPNMTPIEMLLKSSSDRIGALHFQEIPDQYQSQYENHATLEQLLTITKCVEAGQLVPKELDVALLHGTSVGGARPKAMIDNDNKKYIAKFASSTDLFPIVQAEFATMWLAKHLGITTSNVELHDVHNKKALLVERFDRENIANQWTRKFITSALTLLGLRVVEGRYASYLDLAQTMIKYSAQPTNDLHELFRRIVFNILVGNTDDHAKNHSFYWDGKTYTLTPAYDICPYPRAGQQATQAMQIGKFGAFSLLKNALSSADYFQLTEQEAQSEIENLVYGVKKYWPEACERAELTTLQQQQLTGSAVLNPYCFYDQP